MAVTSGGTCGGIPFQPLALRGWLEVGGGKRLLRLRNQIIRVLYLETSLEAHRHTSRQHAVYPRHQLYWGVIPAWILNANSPFDPFYPLSSSFLFLFLSTSGSHHTYSLILTFKDFRVGNLLGKGSFAGVYRAESIHTGLEVAIKMVRIY